MAKADTQVKEVRKDLFYADPEEITIVDDPAHHLYDKDGIETPISESMVRNIMHLGRVIQPITVMREGGKIVVVEGRQRVKNCREANKRLAKEGKEIIRIGYIVERNPEASTGIMVSGNEHRRNVSCLERAEKCSKLLAAGRTEQECATLFGVTTQTVKNWQAPLSCCAKVKKAVNAGLLSETAAAQLHKLSTEDQEKKLEKLLDKSTGKATVKKAQKLARNGGETRETIFNKPTKAELEDAIKSEDTPNDVRDVLMWVIGKAERPWKVEVASN